MANDRESEESIPALSSDDVHPLGPTQDDTSPKPTAPKQIGPYRLLQKLGEGGMGSVFMAEQSEPIRRLVAIKLIKSGIDSDQVIARFEAERQALAMMNHPRVAPKTRIVFR
ncbi:MAG: hypothetical protein AB8G99_12900 [Planctomycetaceae bacterium]